MAGIVALQGTMASLSVSVPGFWDNRLSTYSVPQPEVCCCCLQPPFIFAAPMFWQITSCFRYIRVWSSPVSVAKHN
jgi:hypothetical protein